MLSVEALHHAYAPGEIAIADLSFTVGAGEIVAIVGPSGCGKTTLLKALAGLVAPTGGDIRFQGKPVRGVPPGLAMVFQEYGRSLFAWTTVRANVELPLRYQPLNAIERAGRVSHSLEAVGLAGFEHRYPWQLSGGMQQRVAIARALAYQPKLLLMDEPFASVDAQTRADLEDLTAVVRDRFDITIVLVTHESAQKPTSAFTEGDRHVNRSGNSISGPISFSRVNTISKYPLEFAAQREASTNTTAVHFRSSVRGCISEKWNSLNAKAGLHSCWPAACVTPTSPIMPARNPTCMIDTLLVLLPV